MMTTADKTCRKLGIRAECVYGAERPPVQGDWQPAHSWTVTLSWKGPPPIFDSKAPVRRITVPFYQGAGHSAEPTAADVLSCLILDASAADYDSFEQWAEDFGYDTDSRKAERVYRACCETAKRLERFLEGVDEDTLDALRDH